ncbi:hemolysin family protein [Undibacterium sp. Ji67W]|uniref:hemolysin family protein n=1 Tax=Undibacterium sp. Ji67W TaxID=3413042 RepID=UPI003BF44DED
MNTLILIALIALNGLFALSEMSIVASKKSRLQTLADAGDTGAKAALALANDPNRILATTQLGLTFVTLLEGSFGSNKFAGQIASLIPEWEWIISWKENAAQIFVLVVITAVTLVLGEMLPKRAALLHPEKIARVIAPLAQRLVAVLSPLVTTLSFCTNRLMEALGLPLVRSEAVSEEDVETMIDAAGQSGLITEREKTIMENVWRLDERKVGAIMTPRQDIRYIDISKSHRENLDTFIQYPRLRLVVTEGGLDCILGMAPTSRWTEDVMNQLRAGEHDPKIDWENNLCHIHRIPNSLTLIETLESFRTHKTHVGLVYNEFGQVEGIISMADLMNALVGEILQNTDEEAQIQSDKDCAGRWIVDGLASISDTSAALNLGELPIENQGNYQTAGGFALWMIGRTKMRLPKKLDSFEYAGLRWEIVDIDHKNGYRIDQILVERIEQSDNPGVSTDHELDSVTI